MSESSKLDVPGATAGPSLLPPSKHKSVAAESKRYTQLFLGLVFFQGPIISWSLYLAFSMAQSVISPEYKALIDLKLQTIRQYGLQYLYIAYYMIYLTRLVLMTNTNSARGPTRLDRPDQHIYQVVGSNDLVLMANHGVNGRFNRAQRALVNMDEGLPLFMAATGLVAPIFGEVACFFLVPLYAYGRIRMAYGYSSSVPSRGSGFFYSMVAEHGMASFVPLIVIKALVGDSIPF